MVHSVQAVAMGSDSQEPGAEGLMGWPAIHPLISFVDILVLLTLCGKKGGVLGFFFYLYFFLSSFR